MSDRSMGRGPRLAERLGVTTCCMGTVTLSGLVMVDTAEAIFRAVDFSELARNPHYLESSVGDEQLPGREM